MSQATARALQRDAAILLKKELQETQRVTWTPYKHTHVVRGKNIDWSDVVRSTKGGDAKYLPGTDVELLERTVHQTGTPVTSGKTWKVMEFDEVIGASDGKQVRWMRVEESANTIYGHPITLE